MAPPLGPRPRRALRLAFGVASGTAVGFGLALPLPYLTPMLVMLLLVQSNHPLGAKTTLALALVVGLTTGTGLLLSPLLTHQPLAGVLLVALGLFLCFRFKLRGGNAMLATLLIIGLSLITAAGTTSLALGQTVIEAMLKAVLITTVCVAISHWLFPDPPGTPAAPPAPRLPMEQANWVALRALLVVMPAWLLAVIDPASYLPLVMKSVELGQQSCSTRARDAAREILGSTLLGGVLAMLFWGVLTICPQLWLFFLLMLLVMLMLARRLYQLVNNRMGPGFWINTGTTLIILLGQSVQDSANGKDVYAAFAVRMGLFLLVTLYACAAVHLLDRRAGPLPRELQPCS